MQQVWNKLWFIIHTSAAASEKCTSYPFGSTLVSKFADGLVLSSITSILSELYKNTHIRQSKIFPQSSQSSQFEIREGNRDDRILWIKMGEKMFPFCRNNGSLDLYSYWYETMKPEFLEKQFESLPSTIYCDPHTPTHSLPSMFISSSPTWSHNWILREWDVLYTERSQFKISMGKLGI